MDADVPCRAVDATSSDASDGRNAAESKVLLLALAERLGSVSKACKLMDYSRDSFYRWSKLYDAGGESALQRVSRRQPILKNRVAPDIEAAVLKLALEHPTWGQARVANALEQRGLSISAAGVRCVWLRKQLQTVPLRLSAVEANAARDGSTGDDSKDPNDATSTSHLG
jgi:transposase